MGVIYDFPPGAFSTEATFKVYKSTTTDLLWVISVVVKAVDVVSNLGVLVFLAV